MPDATDLHTLAAALLQASSDALDGLPGPLAGAPQRQFVSPGAPAFDCCEDGQLTVHTTAIGEDPHFGPVGSGVKHRASKAHVNLATFVVTIVRCVGAYGDGGPPDPAAMEAVAEQTNADAWALWNGLWSATVSGDLFSVCGEVYFDGLRAVPTSGNCAGWTLQVRASLDGYDG